ncbi:MAG: acetyl-CoA hydrolase [Alphaproteobacteria bacterium]|nr:acetyl-CoA hydrolase [Alphaproteobacteria bacterium]
MTERVAPEHFEYAPLVQRGDAVVWGQLTAEPTTLVELLSKQAVELGGISAFVGLALSQALEPEAARYIDLSFAGGGQTNHRFARNGALNTLPVHLSRIPGHLLAGEIPCNVALISAAQDQENGPLNLSLSADYMGAAAKTARIVIAEVNDRIPVTFGDTEIGLDNVDALVTTSRPPPVFNPPALGDAERAIGGHIASLIPDRATLQTGVGAIPSAALEALAGKRDLGIHTGLLTDAIVALIEAGAVSNRYKPIDAGKSVTAVIYGTPDLYRWAHRNRTLSVRDVTHTHSAGVLAEFERFFAINAAIEVDLTGQVNGEIAGGRPVGLIGGQVDFGRGALASPGGRSIIALRSTARRGTVSTIVPELSGGVVTTARSDVDVIATEYGIAELAGVPVFERARRLIAIAHPDFRKNLEASLDRLC